MEEEKIVTYTTPNFDRPLPNMKIEFDGNICNDEFYLERWRMEEDGCGWEDEDWIGAI